MAGVAVITATSNSTEVIPFPTVPLGASQRRARGHLQFWGAHIHPSEFENTTKKTQNLEKKRQPPICSESSVWVKTSQSRNSKPKPKWNSPFLKVQVWPIVQNLPEPGESECGLQRELGVVLTSPRGKSWRFWRLLRVSLGRELVQCTRWWWDGNTWIFPKVDILKYPRKNTRTGISLRRLF